MSTLFAHPNEAPNRPPLDPQNPWPGLDSFRESEQKFFRGRSQDARQLLALVERTQISVLYGVSGIGKSSLLQAGLFPLLRARGYLPIRIRLDFSNENLDLIAQMKQAVLSQSKAAGVEAPLSGELETLWEYFHRRDEAFWDDRNRLLAPVLIFDQFEELFTLGSVRGSLSPRSLQFIAQLAQLVEGNPPDALQEWLTEHPEDVSKFLFRRHHYRIVISMRDDYLGHLDDFRTLMPSIAADRKRLLPMDGSAALRVVGQVANLVSREVAEQIVRFVAASESPDRELAELTVDPSLLSVMCSELNEKRKRHGEPTITGDLLEGSRHEILHAFYERAMADICPAVQTFIEEKLIIDPGYRDTVALDVAPDVPGAREDLECLIRRRLIRAEQRGPVRRLEVTHDLLVPVIRDSRNKRRSEEKAAREEAARIEAEQRELQARRSLRKTRLYLAVFVLVSVIAVCALVFARIAEARANLNKQIAEDAMDNLSGLAASHSVEVPDEPPETLAFRERLLVAAQAIYKRFTHSDFNTEDLRREVAMEHFRTGDLNRMRGNVNAAISEYETAIGELSALMREYPGKAGYAEALADVYLWLGETERPIAALRTDAKKAFDNSVDVHLTLRSNLPENLTYQQGLGEAYDDRGILQESLESYADASRDFRSAIALLTPLASSGPGKTSDFIDVSRRDLANAENNLALLLRKTGGSVQEAADLYDHAIALGSTLVRSSSSNLEYKLHLAEFNNNSAILLADANQKLATERNAAAINLLRQLIEPPPYLNARLGLYYSTRGSILDSTPDYTQAIGALRSAVSKTDDRTFHIWLGQALTNLAEASRTKDIDAIPLLKQAIAQQEAAGSNYNLAWDYYYLAFAYTQTKSIPEMRVAADKSRALLADLLPEDQKQLQQLLDSLPK